MAGLSARDQAIIQFTIESKTSSAMARKLGVCPSAIQHRKRRLAKAILGFMGDAILVQLQRRANWKDDLSATKEKMACKHERQH